MKASNLITHLGMSVSLLTVLLMLCAGMARGQAAGQVQEEWVVRYNGRGNEVDDARAIAVDGAGNIYVTGYSTSGHDEPSADCATFKYDPAGNELWVAYYDGSENQNGFDGGEAIAVDSSGNIYVAGGSSRSGSSLYQDYTTIKYDPAGDQLWAAHYRGPGNNPDVAKDIALDKSGNVYVTGVSWTAFAHNAIDCVTIKYDTNGNQLWVARYNGPENLRDEAEAIALDASGNVYVTGRTYLSGKDSDYSTIKYDPNGNQLWVARYNGPGNAEDRAYAMTLDASGNIYVTGGSYGGGTGQDYATIKYDPDGNQLWVARYNGPGNDRDVSQAIVLDKSNNVYITGYSPGSGTGQDYATIKYDTNGNQLWVARYNGPGNGADLAHAIALDASGNVYVTGRTYASGTDQDCATIKYDHNGNQLWVVHYNGPGNRRDVSQGIALDGACNVYVTGYSWSGSDMDTSDYVTIKYSQDSQIGDLSCDNDVDLADLALLAANWLETDCGQCGGADLSGDGDVDLEDFAILGACWLAGVE